MGKTIIITEKQLKRLTNIVVKESMDLPDQDLFHDDDDDEYRDYFDRSMNKDIDLDANDDDFDKHIEHRIKKHDDEDWGEMEKMSQWDMHEEPYDPESDETDIHPKGSSDWRKKRVVKMTESQLKNMIEKMVVESQKKRDDQVSQGAYDGRFRTKVVKDKKKESNKNWARKKDTQVNEGGHSDKELKKVLRWLTRTMNFSDEPIKSGGRLCPPSVTQIGCYSYHTTDRAVDPILRFVAKYTSSTYNDVRQAYRENKTVSN